MQYICFLIILQLNFFFTCGSIIISTVSKKHHKLIELNKLNLKKIIDKLAETSILDDLSALFLKRALLKNNSKPSDNANIFRGQKRYNFPRKSQDRVERIEILFEPVVFDEKRRIFIKNRAN